MENHVILTKAVYGQLLTFLASQKYSVVAQLIGEVVDDKLTCEKTFEVSMKEEVGKIYKSPVSNAKVSKPIKNG